MASLTAMTVNVRVTEIEEFSKLINALKENFDALPGPVKEAVIELVNSNAEPVND